MGSALEARIRIVQSPSNHWVKLLRGAVAHPPSFAAAHKGALIAAEGFHLLAEALRANLIPVAIFIREDLREDNKPDTMAKLKAALQAPLPEETQLLILPQNLLTSILETEAPQGIAALIPAPAPAKQSILSKPLSPRSESIPQPIQSNAESLRPYESHHATGSNQPPELNAKQSLVLLLASIQDPGNVGTLLRSAQAFDATCALLLTGTATPWSGKSLRASAGAAFHLPMLAVQSAEEAANLLRRHNIRSYAAVAKAATPAHRCNLSEPTALWIGNEGAGLSQAEQAACEERITLPMPGQTESLNAAIAGSLLLYEASRQRML